MFSAGREEALRHVALHHGAWFSGASHVCDQGGGRMKSEVGVRIITGHDGQRWEVNFEKKFPPRSGEVAEEHIFAMAIPPMVGERMKGHVTRVPISSALARLEAEQPVVAVVPVFD